jgi:hypothetical protein
LSLIPQLFLRNDTMLFKVATEGPIGISKPLMSIWRVLGFRGVEDLRIVIPMVGSVLLYLAGLGFMAGILVRRAISLKVRG